MLRVGVMLRVRVKVRVETSIAVAASSANDTGMLMLLRSLDPTLLMESLDDAFKELTREAFKELTRDAFGVPSSIKSPRVKVRVRLRVGGWGG